MIAKPNKNTTMPQADKMAITAAQPVNTFQFLRKAVQLMMTAVMTSTSRSTSNGMETTETANTIIASTPPRMLPVIRKMMASRAKNVVQSRTSSDGTVP